MITILIGQFIIFVTVGFVYSRWRSTVTDRWCRQEHLTRHFSPAQCAHWMMYTHIIVQVFVRVMSSPCSSVMSGWAFVLWLSVPRLVPSRVSLSYPSLFSLYSVLNLFFHVDNAKAINYGASANWGVLPLGRIHSSHNKRRKREILGPDDYVPTTRDDRNQESNQGSLGDVPQVQAGADIEKLHARTSSPVVRRSDNSDDMLRIWNIGTHLRTRNNDTIDATKSAPPHHTNKKKIQKDRETQSQDQRRFRQLWLELHWWRERRRTKLSLSQRPGQWRVIREWQWRRNWRCKLNTLKWAPMKLWERWEMRRLDAGTRLTKKWDGDWRWELPHHRARDGW